MKETLRWSRKKIWSDGNQRASWSGLGEVEDVRPIIANADVVVLPSYREWLPRSLLEAAAMAKPVITTDAVGCRDAVEHGRTGLMVPVKDPAALAGAMKDMIKNPEMHSHMGKEGRWRVEREFDERIVLRKILEVYECEKLSA